MLLFSHTDESGDELEVRTNPRSDELLFGANGSDCVSTDRDVVLRLHAALGEWLYPSRPQPSKQEWDKAMEGFRNMATGLANAILPLSEAFKAAGFPTAAPEEDADPEPKDVGHSEPTTPTTSSHRQLVGCTCGHSWTNHNETGCTCVQRRGVFLECPCARKPPKAETVPPLVLCDECGRCNRPSCPCEWDGGAP